MCVAQNIALQRASVVGKTGRATAQILLPFKTGRLNGTGESTISCSWAFLMFKSHRPPLPTRSDPPWVVRYRLEGADETVAESYLTKQNARDRYFTVKQFAGLYFCELREPSGKLWFRDHFFEKGPK